MIKKTTLAIGTGKQHDSGGVYRPKILYKYSRQGIFGKERNIFFCFHFSSSVRIPRRSFVADIVSYILIQAGMITTITISQRNVYSFVFYTAYTQYDYGYQRVCAAAPETNLHNGKAVINTRK
ncbi:hypothetical protein QTP88_004589 [Uroleucon formosanum]